MNFWPARNSITLHWPSSCAVDGGAGVAGTGTGAAGAVTPAGSGTTGEDPSVEPSCSNYKLNFANHKKIKIKMMIKPIIANPKA